MPTGQQVRPHRPAVGRVEGRGGTAATTGWGTGFRGGRPWTSMSAAPRHGQLHYQVRMGPGGIMASPPAVCNVVQGKLMGTPVPVGLGSDPDTVLPPRPPRHVTLCI